MAKSLKGTQSISRTRKAASPRRSQPTSQQGKQNGSRSHNKECVRTSTEDGLVFIDGFLTEQECKQLLEELEFVFWQPSLIYERQDDGLYRNLLSPLRVSQTSHEEWFGNEMDAVLRRIEKRLKKLFDVDSLHLEPWQATTYDRNGQFYYHLDAGYWDDHYAGDRILTFLLYLTTPQQGGGTHFRALDTYIEAKAGRLLVWNNLFPNGNCNYRMIHSSAPLLKGRKTTLVTWQRQRRYKDIK
jgi:prolyl 4-hydroxylase